MRAGGGVVEKSESARWEGKGERGAGCGEGGGRAGNGEKSFVLKAALALRKRIIISRKHLSVY